MAKKINTILKGVAITGATVGGASILGEADLVYAETVEETSSEAGEVFIDYEAPADTTPSQEVAMETTQQTGQEVAQDLGLGTPVEQATPVTELPQEPSAEQPAGVETPQEPAVEQPAGVETPQEPVAEQPAAIETPQEQPEEVATNRRLMAAPRVLMATAPAPTDAEVPQEPAETQSEAPTLTDEELSESAAASLSEEEELLASTSESQSLSMESTSTSLSEAIVANEADLEAESKAFEESAYSKDGVADKVKDANEALKTVNAALDAAKANKKNLNGNNFYNDDVGRNLAIEMIKLKFLLDGEVDGSRIDDVFYQFYQKDYYNNHFVVKYIKDGEYKERYFDYVTCENNGESIYKGQKPYSEDSYDKVFGINVVEKKPVYSDKYKKQTVWGQSFDYVQRDAFEDSKDYTKNKGKEWYTRNQFLSDLATYKGFVDGIDQLGKTVDELKGKASELTDFASTSLAGSLSAAEERAASLASSAEASTVASTAASTAASESAASLSTSMSEAEAQNQNQGSDGESASDAAPIAGDDIGLDILDDIIPAAGPDVEPVAEEQAVADSTEVSETTNTAETTETAATTQTAATTETAATTQTAATTETAATTQTATTTTADNNQSSGDTSTGNTSSGNTAPVQAQAALNDGGVEIRAIGDEDVPLNVIHEEDNVTTAGVIERESVDVTEDIGAVKIEDAEVAKGIKVTDNTVEKKRFFFWFTGLIIGAITFFKTKRDIDKEEK